MGQFAAVIVPQYCGAPAEKPGVLEWAIALKALEMAEQAHPFPGHPTMGFPPAGGSHQLQSLHFGSWVQTEGHPPGNSCLSPKLSWPLSVKSPVRKRGTPEAVPTGPVALPHMEPLLTSPQGCAVMFFEAFSVLIWTRDWETISGHCPGMRSFMKLCKRYQLS